jgi:RNA polymerase sigma-70 factor (ECF subfamily)
MVFLGYETDAAKGLRKAGIPAPLPFVVLCVGSSDEALLAGLAAGDRDAAAAFVRRFQRRVYGLAYTIVGDAGTAEDVAQETFLRAWRHAGGYDARRGRVATWLLAIARNVAIDAVRLSRAQPMDPDVLASRLQLEQGRESDVAPSAVADRELLRRALAELPDEQRRAVVLASFFGRTAREVGEQEGVPLGTAKTRIRSGMIRLREALEVPDER